MSYESSFNDCNEHLEYGALLFESTFMVSVCENFENVFENINVIDLIELIDDGLFRVDLLRIREVTSNLSI